MERFFPADRIVMTGNPLRGNFSDTPSRAEALKYFGFTADKPVLMVVGGSLGSRTFNEMMKRWVEHIVNETEVQVSWQTGKYYEAEIDEFMAGKPSGGIWRGAFIDRMDYAYAAADLVISRSGAITVSELCLLGKAVMFVPSPNVAEDHQTKNAMALVDKDAAEICPDGEATERAIPTAIQLVYDKERLAALSTNIKKSGVPDSADRVAEIIVNYD
jgi:UDP-N-acetylglucosamine--N-acetylmuramyl-(pentapeptide) pyrophosphoryl-undecaprenol N-acetylglucosamine transferase